MDYLDTAILDRLEEMIMGENLTRKTNALRESQNIHGVFHSTPASESERRVVEDARRNYQQGLMSLFSDAQNRNIQNLGQMQNVISQAQGQAQDQYNTEYQNYLNQLEKYNKQQDTWAALAQPTMENWGWI